MDTTNQSFHPLYRKLFDYDKVCFKSCVNTPEKEFSAAESECLQNCTLKLVEADSYVQHLNSQKGRMGL